jgi:hypothetical protein
MLVRTILGGEAAPLPLISMPMRSIPCKDPSFMQRDEEANLMVCTPSPHVVAVLQVSRHYFGLPGQERKASPYGAEL